MLMKALWVSNHSPFKLDFGGGQRSNLIYRTLQEIAELDVLILERNQNAQPSDGSYGRGDGRLEVVHPTTRGQRLPWSLSRPLAPALVDRVAHNVGRRVVDYGPNPAVMRTVQRMMEHTEYDFFVGRHLKNAGQAGLLKLRRAIVDIDDNDIEAYRWISRDPTTGTLRKLVLRRRARTLEALIPKLLADGPHLWVTKEEDLASFGFGRARVLPNIPLGLAEGGDAALLSPQPGLGSKRILFVGMLGYLYNVQGIDWFLSEVWPAVKAQKPDAEFRLVGSRLQEPDRLRWSKVPGVEVVGFVDDVSVAYRECQFVVAPIWSGGGTNIKILEALLHARTCVVTSAAHKGFSRTLPEGETLLVARDAGAMISHCLRLLENGDLCREMGLRGATAIIQHYSFSKFREIVLETVEAALSSNSPPSQ